MKFSKSKGRPRNQSRRDRIKELRGWGFTKEEICKRLGISEEMYDYFQKEK